MKRYIKCSIVTDSVYELGEQLRQKRYAGLNDAIEYMSYDGSVLNINYRNYSGNTSAWMSNDDDLGPGISVRNSVIDSLEKYLANNGYVRVKSRLGTEYEYEYVRRQ